MSRIARSALRNTALLVAFEVANPLLSLALVGTISRRLGAEGLGIYNLLLNLFFVAHSITSLGLNPLITREVSRSPASATRYLCSASALGFIFSVLTFGGLLVAVTLGNYDANVARASWIIGIALFPSVAILYSESIFIAFEKVKFIVYLAVLENVARVLIGLGLLLAGFGVLSLIVTFAALRFMTLALNLWVFHRRIAPLRWSFEGGIVRDFLRSVPVFGGILVASTLYMRIDVLLLSQLGSLAAVGYYSAAYRLFAISQVVPKSFNTSIYPIFAKFFQQSRESFHWTSSLSIRYILVVLLPISAGVYGVAEPLTRTLFGQDFGPAVPALKVIIWTLIPYGLVRILASTLFASNRQLIDLKVNILGLTINLALNLALIPRHGFLGCAWATLLSSILFLFLQCWFLRDEIFPVLRRAEILRPALAAASMLLWLVITPGVTLVVRILGAAAIYAALLMALRVVPWHHLKAVLPVPVEALPREEREP